MNTNENNQIFPQLKRKWSDLKTLVRDFSSFPPKRKLEHLHKIGKFCGYLIGVRCFGDCKVNWFSYAPGAFISMYFVFAFFTSVVNISQGRLVECLPSWCVSGLLLSVCVRFVSTKKKFQFNIIL